MREEPKESSKKEENKIVLKASYKNNKFSYNLRGCTTLNVPKLKRGLLIAFGLVVLYYFSGNLEIAAKIVSLFQ